MNDSPIFRTLHEGLFDYAGMFPPASLSIEEALAESASFTKTLQRPYLLNADIVLAYQDAFTLKSETLIKAGFPASKELKIAVLGSPLTTAGTTVHRGELERLKELTGRGSRLRLVSYELKLQTPLGVKIRPLISEVLPNVPDGCLLCLEPDLNKDDWLARVTGLCTAMNDGGVKERLAFKVRAAGPTAITTVKMAKLLERIGKLELNLKATAGLHHPVVERARYGNSMGFVGLLAAVYISRAYAEAGLASEDLKACLESKSMKDFEMNYSELVWRDYSVALGELQSLKSKTSFTIGSCSLREPDLDLTRLLSA